MVSWPRGIRWYLAILPIQPFHGVLSEIGAHSLTNGCEGVLAAEPRREPEAFQLVFDRILHLGKAQLDALGMQCIIELGNRVRGRDVDTGDGLSRDDEPPDRCR